MGDNTTQTVYPLPAVIDPPDHLCVVVHVPNEEGHRQAFLGAVWNMTRWYSWQRDPDHKGREVAAVWLRVYDEMLECFYMPCCCTNPLELQQRLATDGTMEVSTDGGATWTPAEPTEDPRLAGSYVAPVDTGSSDGKCAAANSLVTFMKQEQGAASAKRHADAELAQITALVIGFLVAVGVIATGGALAILGAGLGLAIATIDADSFDAAFTDDLWAELLCKVFCALDDTGLLLQADVLTIAAALAADFPGIGGRFIHDMLVGMGQVGATNAARSGLPGALSCDDCDCMTTCPGEYTIKSPFISPNHGIIVGRDGDVIHAQMGSLGYFIMGATDINTCCFINSISNIEGGTVTACCHILCGNDYISEGSWIFATPVGLCPSFAQWQGTAGATFDINLGTCP